MFIDVTFYLHGIEDVLECGWLAESMLHVDFFLPIRRCSAKEGVVGVWPVAMNSCDDPIACINVAPRKPAVLSMFCNRFPEKYMDVTPKMI